MNQSNPNYNGKRGATYKFPGNGVHTQPPGKRGAPWKEQKSHHQSSSHQVYVAHPQGSSHQGLGTHLQGSGPQGFAAHPQGSGPKGLVGQPQSNQQNQTSFHQLGAFPVPTSPENIHGAQPPFDPQTVGNPPSYPGNQPPHRQDEENDFSDNYNNAGLPSNLQLAYNLEELIKMTDGQNKQAQRSFQKIGEDISRLSARLAALEVEINDTPDKVAEMLLTLFNEFKACSASKADDADHGETGSINLSEIFNHGSGNFDMTGSH